MNLVAISVGLAACLLVAGTAAAAPTDAARRGYELFHGIGPFAQPAQVAGVSLPSDAGACHTCHGRRGEGGLVEGQRVPQIAWDVLRTRSEQRPGYASPNAVLDAVRGGRREDGSALSSAMPRYALTADEQSALAGYLQIVGTAQDPVPGVDGQTVRIVSVGPGSGAASRAYREALAGMERVLEDVNAQGGVYGRRVQLDSRTWRSEEQWKSQVQTLSQDESVLAVVGGWLGGGGSQELRSAVASEQWNALPWMVSLGSPLKDESAGNLTWLLPSVAGQVSTVLEALRANPACDMSRGVRLVAGVEQKVLADQLRQLEPGLRTVEALDAGVRSVLMVGAAGETPKGVVCRAELALFGVRPTKVHPLQRVIGVPAPVFTDAGSPDDLWRQLGAGAAKVFIEALRTAGAHPDRESLQRNLLALRDLEIAPGIAVSYSPRQRHGFSKGFAIWESRE